MKRMLINATQPEELRVAIVDGQSLYEERAHGLKDEAYDLGQKVGQALKQKVPAEVLAGDRGLALDVLGQRITLPRGGPHVIGTRLWLSVARVLPRPEPGDSAEIGR